MQGSSDPCTKCARIPTPGPEGHWASKDWREGAEEDNRRISGFFVSQVVIVPGRRVAKPQTANKQSVKGSKSCKRLAAGVFGWSQHSLVASLHCKARN